MTWVGHLTENARRMDSASSESGGSDKGVTPEEALALAASLLKSGQFSPAAEIYRRVTTLADESKQLRARDILGIAHEVIRRRPAAMAAESSSIA